MHVQILSPFLFVSCHSYTIQYKCSLIMPPYKVQKCTLKMGRNQEPQFRFKVKDGLGNGRSLEHEDLVERSRWRYWSIINECQPVKLFSIKKREKPAESLHLYKLRRALKCTPTSSDWPGFYASVLKVDLLVVVALGTVSRVLLVSLWGLCCHEIAVLFSRT